jgi:hypothetical protein
MRIGLFGKACEKATELRAEPTRAALADTMILRLFIMKHPSFGLKLIKMREDAFF